MTRGPFIRSIALPLAAAMLVAVLWVRSYRVMDEWSMANDHGEVRSVVVYQGAVHCVRNRTRAATRPISYDVHEIPDGATWADLYGSTSVAWHAAGFWKLESRPDASTRTGKITPFPTPPPPPVFSRTQIASWLFGPMQTTYVFPFWPALALALLPPTRLAWKRWRQSRRATKGLCPKCRYDLRATPGRCPECGWESETNSAS